MVDSVTESIYIKASKAKVFDAFVNHINEWWPRKGKYNYSFAPEHTKPATIVFEPKLGGRFIETFESGEQFQIGEITEWQPPDQFYFTWKGEEYTAPTLVQVYFTQADAHTKVTLTHSGFAAAGVPEYAEGYGAGWNEILEKLTAWFEANPG